MLTILTGDILDEADAAEYRIESVIEDGINHARYMMEKTKLVPCGSCYYCGSGVNNGSLYCDEDCRKDHIYEQNQKRIAGK